jgi:hypothetical protein
MIAAQETGVEGSEDAVVQAEEVEPCKAAHDRKVHENEHQREGSFTRRIDPR